MPEEKASEEKASEDENIGRRKRRKSEKYMKKCAVKILQEKYKNINNMTKQRENKRNREICTQKMKKFNSNPTCEVLLRKIIYVAY